MRARALAAASLAAVSLASCLGPLRRGGSEAPGPDALRGRLAELAEAPGPPAHLVLVSIAGLEPAHYGASAAVGAPAAPPVAPTLALLAELGVAAELVEPIAPPASYPAHATLVTGRPPREHGIVADHRLGERGVRSERASHASLLRAPALWQLAAERRLPVAALDWPTTVGAGVEALLPDVVPTRRGERWAALAEAAATPALAARVREASKDDAALGRPGVARDALLVELACELLAGPRPPALTLLRLRGAETALRDAGPASPSARAAFAAADAEVGRLLACLDDAGLLGASAVAIAGDRALHAVHTAIRPNALLAQARLVRLDARGGVAEWAAVARSNGGSAFVYARDEARALEARGVL
jgi:Type I phosphodiesterase / nucleotide pyrophosphatase